MRSRLSQPIGNVSKEPNKQAIARIFGVKQSEVTYLKAGVDLLNFKVLYDKETQLCFWKGNATGTITSWSVTGTVLSLVSSGGTFSLVQAKAGDWINTSNIPLSNFDRGVVSDLLNYITPWMWGIKPELRKTSGSLMTDVTEKLQAMFTYAKDNKKIVDMQVPCTVGSSVDSLGFYTKGPIDLTGVGTIRGKLYTFVDGSEFTDTSGFNFAIRVNNATFSGTTMTGLTTLGDASYDWIETRNVNTRVGTVQGILWTATRSTARKLRAHGFNGRGVWLATAYDSNIDRIEVEHCGNKDDWAMDAAFYTPYSGTADETNGLKIGGMLIHNCHNRAWRVYGSKCRVDNVHEEATYCYELPTTPSTQDTRTSLGYMNSYFSSRGGSIGSISIQPAGVLPDGAPSGSTVLPHVHAIGFTATEAGNILTTGKTVIMNGDPGSSGGSIGDIYTGDLYVISGARTTIGHVEVIGNFYGRATRNDSPILGGYITNVIENIGDIHNVIFRNAATLSSSVSSSYIRCTFNNPFFNVGSGRATMDNCIFAYAKTLINNTKMDFLNCLFQGKHTISGTVLDVIYKGGQINGDLDFSSPTGSWLLPDPPRVTGAVTNWVWPTATAVTGSRTRHPAPDATVGTSVERVYNGTAWVVTVKITA